MTCACESQHGMRRYVEVAHHLKSSLAGNGHKYGDNNSAKCHFGFRASRFPFKGKRTWRGDGSGPQITVIHAFQDEPRLFSTWLMVCHHITYSAFPSPPHLLFYIIRMADALCGPSNALQTFQKQTSIDRTLQQDRIAARQAQVEVFSTIAHVRLNSYSL